MAVIIAQPRHLREPPQMTLRNRLNARDRLKAHAPRNHGVASLQQLREMGFSDGAIRHMARRGEIERFLPGVYVITGAPRSWKQSQLAACVWAGTGSASSGRAAARLHRLEGIETKLIEVTVPGHHKKAPQGIVLRRTNKPLMPIRRIDAVPVTDISRTLFDLASCVDQESLEIALDDCLFRGLVSVGYLDRKLSEFGSAGRAGMKDLRLLLAERLNGIPPSQGRFNVKLRRLFRHCPYLAIPDAEYPIVEDGGFIRRVDFAYPHVKLAIEGESRKHHTGAAWERHNARINALTAAGWEILHATWADVQDGGARLLPHVAVVLAQREEIFGSASLWSRDHEVGVQRRAMGT